MNSTIGVMPTSFRYAKGLPMFRKRCGKHLYAKSSLNTLGTGAGATASFCGVLRAMRSEFTLCFIAYDARIQRGSGFFKRRKISGDE